MMSLDTIREINRKATRQASRHGKQPFVPTAAQKTELAKGVLQVAGVNIPFLADYVPRAWERTEDDPWFCDISGWGSPGEPALTMGQLAKEIARIPEGYGIALIEHGQFQGYVAQYRPKQKLPNMKRWSKAKLEKELAFAGPADDGSPASKAWIAALNSEQQRRNTV